MVSGWGLSLSEIREILDLYNSRRWRGGRRWPSSLKKFRERIVAFEAQREDVEHAIELNCATACAHFEGFRLAQVRPDLLPQAADYDSVLRARLDGVHEMAAK